MHPLLLIALGALFLLRKGGTAALAAGNRLGLTPGSPGYVPGKTGQPSSFEQSLLKQQQAQNALLAQQQKLQQQLLDKLKQQSAPKGGGGGGGGGGGSSSGSSSLPGWLQALTNPATHQVDLVSSPQSTQMIDPQAAPTSDAFVAAGGNSDFTINVNPFGSPSDPSGGLSAATYD